MCVWMAVWECSSGLKGKQGQEGTEMGGGGGGKYEVGGRGGGGTAP